MLQYVTVKFYLQKQIVGQIDLLITVCQWLIHIKHF